MFQQRTCLWGPWGCWRVVGHAHPRRQCQAGPVWNVGSWCFLFKYCTFNLQTRNSFQQACSWVFQIKSAVCLMYIFCQEDPSSNLGFSKRSKTCPLMSSMRTSSRPIDEVSSTYSIRYLKSKIKSWRIKQSFHLIFYIYTFYFPFSNCSVNAI